jgi:hypothetical protein
MLRLTRFSRFLRNRRRMRNRHQDQENALRSLLDLDLAAGADAQVFAELFGQEKTAGFVDCEFHCKEDGTSHEIWQ